MQATPVKQAAKTALTNKSFNPTLVQKIEVNVIELAEPQSADLNKTQSFNRFLEAFGDCV